MTLAMREGTSDDCIVSATFAGDEYRLHDRRLSGWAIDLGAHIGICVGFGRLAMSWDIVDGLPPSFRDTETRAVPWSTDTRTTGRPTVMLTPSSPYTDLNGACPWS